MASSPVEQGVPMETAGHTLVRREKIVRVQAKRNIRPMSVTEISEAWSNGPRRQPSLGW